ncbi:MAG: peptidoglycan DD-metalloendopeptidase family protein [Phocaeicola vulgatus]
MRKVYYIYNPKTRTYDRIYPTVRQRALSILRRLFVGMGLGAGSFIILLLIFGSPSEKELRIENTRLLAQYNVLSHRLDEAMGVMQDIQQRDDNLYRVVLQADPVSDAVRKAGYGGTNRYEQLRDMANADLVINTTQKLDMLNRQLYIQSKSFDEVVDLCKNHDEMLKCIPAIMPVSNKNLKKTASGYGVRIDPIYKTAKFHAGMDFSANIGTPVYATGDGIVVKAGWETGYGNIIEVDHGFGYRDLVCTFKQVIRFDRDKRWYMGEVIGAVGSTGKSTGPHLHYEVHVKGKVQNPVNYYFMDLSAEDYDKMIQIAANHGKVFD